MRFDIKISHLIILGLIMVIILQRQCIPSHQDQQVHDTIVISPPIRYIDTFYTPQVDTVIVSKIFKVDTATIIADYLAQRIYSDTIINDSNAMIVIHDTITQNRLQSRWPEVVLHPPMRIRVVDVKKPRAQLYSGFSVSSDGNDLGLSVNILLKTKRDQIYWAGYDVLKKRVQVGIYWKLTFKP